MADRDATVVYKIAVNIPEDRMEEMMNVLDNVVRPIYPGYDHVFCWWPVTGCWRPLEGSSPFLGKVGEVETAREMRVEFAVLEEDLRSVVEAVRGAHPYEEPTIDVIPIIPWRSLTTLDGK